MMQSTKKWDFLRSEKKKVAKKNISAKKRLNKQYLLQKKKLKNKSWK